MGQATSVNALRGLLIHDPRLTEASFSSTLSTFTQAGADTQVFADADGGANGNVLLATLTAVNAAQVQALTLI
jgi:biopolymer transport protein ExbD